MAFVTVPGRVSAMAEPPLSEPPVIVTDSTPPVTPAAAVGDPVPADVNATVLADRLCGALPPRVMRIVLPVGMVSAGVNDIVIVTEPAFLAKLFSVMAGALLPSDPLTMATIVPDADLARMTPSLRINAAGMLVKAFCGAAGF